MHFVSSVIYHIFLSSTSVHTAYHILESITTMIWVSSRAQPLPPVIPFQMWTHKNTITKCQAHTLWNVVFINIMYIYWVCYVKRYECWLYSFTTATVSTEIFSEKTKMNYVRTHFGAIQFFSIYYYYYFATVFQQSEAIRSGLNIRLVAHEWIHSLTMWRAWKMIFYLFLFFCRFRRMPKHAFDVNSEWMDRWTNEWWKHFCASVTYIHFALRSIYVYAKWCRFLCWSYYSI